MRINAYGFMFLILLMMALPLPAGQEDSLAIVANGESASYVLLPSDPSEAELLAANELQSYIHQMTGANLPIHRHDGSLPNTSKTPILLGRGDGHPIISQMIAARDVNLDQDELTEDGFIIKSVAWKDKPCLVVSGVTDVSTVYAAYDLLERFGRVGFFRYDEHVPQRESFTIPPCDIREKPYFKTRMHGGQYHYFGIHWFSEEQWQEELNWFAKHRLNRINFQPGPPVMDLIDAGAWERLGVKSSATRVDSGSTKGQALKMLKRLVPYGLKLGVRAPFISTDGSIPPHVHDAFLKKYPDVRRFEVTRNHHTNVSVHPADPMWLLMNQAILENQIEAFGDTKLYSLPSPYAERAPGNTFDEKERLTADYADAVGRLAAWAEAEHPGAEWMMDGWAFANHAYWQRHRVERFFNALPSSLPMVMWDYPAEDEPSYVMNQYWFDRPWAYIVLNSMAGNSMVHGDVYRLTGDMFRVLCDQRATRMVGFGYYTEARDYAPFFSDLVRHMAWNPMINLDEFVQDYCERRYSLSSVPTMIACHEKMLKTVYGPQSNTHMKDGFRTTMAQNPPYWHGLGENWVPFDAMQHRKVTQRRHWASLLREALADALKAAERERDNPAYVRDLADLMRSYVHARIEEALWDAVDATRRGDAEAFERQYAHADRLFDALLDGISLVAHRWEFGVNALIKEFDDAPLPYSPQQIRHYLHFVTWDGNRIYDYTRSDRYELIRDIYRPKTMDFLKACRSNLAAGKNVAPQAVQGDAYATIMDVTPIPDKVKVDAAVNYKRYIDDFIEGPCAPPPPTPDPIDTANRFLTAARAGDI